MTGIRNLIDEDILLEGKKVIEDLKRGEISEHRRPSYDVCSNKFYHHGYDGDNGR